MNFGLMIQQDVLIIHATHLSNWQIYPYINSRDICSQDMPWNTQAQCYSTNFARDNPQENIFSLQEYFDTLDSISETAQGNVEMYGAPNRITMFNSELNHSSSDDGFIFPYNSRLYDFNELQDIILSFNDGLKKIQDASTRFLYVFNKSSGTIEPVSFNYLRNLGSGTNSIMSIDFF